MQNYAENLPQKLRRATNTLYFRVLHSSNKPQHIKKNDT